MRKSGLHKQISSIFDGVPVPNNEPVQEQTDVASEAVPSQVQDGVEAQSQQETPLLEPQKSAGQNASLIKRMSADPSERASAPSIQVERPMPLPKSAMPTIKDGPGFHSHLKKKLFGSDAAQLDPRQKKMAVLVGILSIVLGVVMFVSLGGVGKSQAIAAEKEAPSASATSSSKNSIESWSMPEPLPADLRDATSPVARHSGSQNGTASETGSSELVVKGILFSKGNPSAIINDKILCVGETVNDTKIINITRDSVEFEADNKTWTQNVQR